MFVFTLAARGALRASVVQLRALGSTCSPALAAASNLADEELGDDLDLINPDVLGEAKQAITDNTHTVLQTIDQGNVTKERIENVEKKVKKEKDPYFKKKQQERLAMLNGQVAMIKVGADSKIELKEKKDRVEDAIYATRAALQEGIVSGGGVALLDAHYSIQPENEGERILLEAIKAPYKTILENANLEYKETGKQGTGVNVVCNKSVNMIKAGIIDPVLVTKTALKNAVSVVNTIISADCIISNVRVNNASN